MSKLSCQFVHNFFEYHRIHILACNQRVCCLDRDSSYTYKQNNIKVVNFEMSLLFWWSSDFISLELIWTVWSVFRSSKRNHTRFPFTKHCRAIF